MSVLVLSNVFFGHTCNKVKNNNKTFLLNMIEKDIYINNYKRYENTTLMVAIFKSQILLLTVYFKVTFINVIKLIEIMQRDNKSIIESLLILEIITHQE